MMPAHNFGGLDAERIWALAAGFPSPMRERRLFVMFTAYLDESETDGHMVIAGYVSDTQRWAQLADDWRQLLDMRSDSFPRIDEFHMTDMHQTPDRMEMSIWYYRLIEKYVHCAVACDINAKDLAQEFQAFKWPSWVVQESTLKKIDNPYVQAFVRITTAIARLHEQLKIEGPIDFVFDEKTDKKHCLLAWEQVMEGAIRRGHRHYYGDTPIFRDSSTMLPLQAADLFAYWARIWFLSGRKGRLPFPWKTNRTIPTLMLHNEAEHFRRDWNHLIGIYTLQRSNFRFTFSQAEKALRPNLSLNVEEAKEDYYDSE